MLKDPFEFGSCLCIIDDNFETLTDKIIDVWVFQIFIHGLTSLVEI